MDGRGSMEEAALSHNNDVVVCVVRLLAMVIVHCRHSIANFKKFAKNKVDLRLTISILKFKFESAKPMTSLLPRSRSMNLKIFNPKYC
jgi:hypothetical protein